MILHQILNGDQLDFDFFQKKDLMLHTQHWLKKCLDTFSVVDGESHYLRWVELVGRKSLKSVALNMTCHLWRLIHAFMHELTWLRNMEDWKHGMWHVCRHLPRPHSRLMIKRLRWKHTMHHWPFKQTLRSTFSLMISLTNLFWKQRLFMFHESLPTFYQTLAAHAWTETSTWNVMHWFRQVHSTQLHSFSFFFCQWGCESLIRPRSHPRTMGACSQRLL